MLNTVLGKYNVQFFNHTVSYIPLCSLIVEKVIDLQFGQTLFENYQYALFLVPASSALAMVVLAFIKAE